MLEKINSFVWGIPLLLLLLVTGIFFTVKSRFFQFTHIKEIFQSTLFAIFKDKSKVTSSGKSTISQFQALSTALGAAMGTGNIAGIATALTLGGPGAVFWLWVSAVTGMIIVYAENYLGCTFREKNNDGRYCGASVSYIKKAFNSEIPAYIFAVFCVLASLGMGNMVQANSASQSLYESFGIVPLASGIGICAVTLLIISGGIKRIGNIMQYLIPVISVFYILGSIAVIIVCYENIPSAFSRIFKGAFGINAIGGGISGLAVRNAVNVGLRRGIFSNEAGLGSSPLLHSESDNSSPHIQGMWGIFEVFTDTIVCCTVTALALICSGAYGSGNDGSAMVISAFENIFGKYAGAVVSIIIVLFAFATMIGWSYCGEKCFVYVLGEKSAPIYRGLFLAAVVAGSVVQLNAVWTISDIFNGLMAVPNLIAILILRKHIKF